MDSKVACGICSKGRSSSRRLNRCGRRVSLLSLVWVGIWCFFGRSHDGNQPTRPLAPLMMVVVISRRRLRGRVHRSGEHLKHKGIGQKKRNRCRRLLFNFFTYLDVHGTPLPSSLHLLYFELAEYINDMCQNGEPHGYAGDLVSAISRAVPRARADPHSKALAEKLDQRSSTLARASDSSACAYRRGGPRASLRQG